MEDGGPSPLRLVRATRLYGGCTEEKKKKRVKLKDQPSLLKYWISNCSKSTFFYRCHCKGSAREGYHFISPACHCPHQRDQGQSRPCYAPALTPGSLLLGSRDPGGNVMSCHWWSSWDLKSSTIFSSNPGKVTLGILFFLFQSFDQSNSEFW